MTIWFYLRSVAYGTPEQPPRYGRNTDCGWSGDAIQRLTHTRTSPYIIYIPQGVQVKLQPILTTVDNVSGLRPLIYRPTRSHTHRGVFLSFDLVLTRTVDGHKWPWFFALCHPADDLSRDTEIVFGLEVPQYRWAHAQADVQKVLLAFCCHSHRHLQTNCAVPGRLHQQTHDDEMRFWYTNMTV